MSFINCGAYVGDSRPASKKALRDAIAAGEVLVSFDTTSTFEPLEMVVIGASDAALAASGSRALRDGERLSVTGPDPYTSRKWYATVEMRAGKVRVS